MAPPGARLAAMAPHGARLAAIACAAVAVPALAALSLRARGLSRLEWRLLLDGVLWRLVGLCSAAYCFGERLLGALVVALLRKRFGWRVSLGGGSGLPGWIALRLSLAPHAESELVIKNFEWACPERPGLRAPYWLRVGRATLRFSLRSLLEALAHAREHGASAAGDRPVLVHVIEFEQVRRFRRAR